MRDHPLDLGPPVLHPRFRHWHRASSHLRNNPSSKRHFEHWIPFLQYLPMHAYQLLLAALGRRARGPLHRRQQGDAVRRRHRFVLDLSHSRCAAAIFHATHAALAQEVCRHCNVCLGNLVCVLYIIKTGGFRALYSLILFTSS